MTEGSDTLSVIYGVTGDNGLTATLSGIQQDLNVFTSFSCNEATLIPGLRVDYIPASCGSPTPTPTATATATRQPQPRLRHGNRYGDSYWDTASNSVTAAAANTGASPVGRSGSKGYN